MDTNINNKLGFTTKEALVKLQDDIRTVLEEYKHKSLTISQYLRNILSFSSERVLLSGVTYTITLIYIFCLVLTYFLGGSVQAHPSLLWEALFLFILLVINLVVALNEDYLYRNEIPHRVIQVLESLDDAIKNSVWEENHYPHLCAPYSPCVILQWTYRDGQTVNLPWALLVEGDVIVLRPGQEVPGHCQGLDAEDPELFFGQIYQPSTQKKESISVPKVREPYQNKEYVMCETPYLKNLRIALEQASSRPVTVFEKQRYLWTVKIMEGMVLPLTLGLLALAAGARVAAGVAGGAYWSDHLLELLAASLPLLQLLLPTVWVLLNCYGLAKFKLLSETGQCVVRPKSCSISEEAASPLLSASAPRRRALLRAWGGALRGRAPPRGILHVLGTLSALCCVDKKGILSWPNPTAEKVFLLRNSDDSSENSSKTSLAESMGPHTHSQTTIDQDSRPTEPTTIVEVLDLTHDQNAPFSVEFDDQRWRRHLPRLKPLGLAAVLNTCAPAPRHTYAHLCHHLTTEALHSEDLVPVTNRRCLCELAKQIGFTDSVAENYTVQDCLGVFRHLQADTIRRETRFVRALQLRTRVKVPLPHMLAVLVRARAEQLHMLTQGTADIILDSCVDYWNGRDLTPIAAADRKKIIDFYQRNSLTAYCTAFAYKPLTRGIAAPLSSMYLELPADSRPLYAPLSQQWADAPALHFHSTDSLLFNEVTDDDVTDAEGYFDMQCNQVFVGMVTMQYQAQSDMVELIERLERACIRFVHFSKENELRSRVFSEKMGLESGWNCHISLMSEEQSKAGSPVSSQTLPARSAPPTDDARLLCNPMMTSKALSMSAPGAINLDHTTVKFDNEIKKARHSITTHNEFKLGRNSVGSARPPSTDSLLGAESPADACRSLSCLTDSTDHSAPLHFDMSNRAKLPRGIENIRPHIEQVDNVPLLVSLFTDCTSRSVRMMIQIMQDYGEVVCVMGSAANCQNMEIFMQADASIAVEPLYPVLCQKMPPYQLPDKCIGPIDLARSLNSLPCSLSMTRDADVSLFALITMSRHFMASVLNAAQFWMCSVCFIALLQCVAQMWLLPSPLRCGAALWAGAGCGALSAALAAAPPPRAAPPRAATRPPAAAHLQTIVFVFWCYACRFLPALISILVIYGLTLRSFCEQLVIPRRAECWLIYPVNVGNFTRDEDLGLKSWHGWGDEFHEELEFVQNIALALVVLHLIVISMSFVHRHSSIWQKCLWSNRVWSATVLVLVLCQCIVSWIQLYNTSGYEAEGGGVTDGGGAAVGGVISGGGVKWAVPLQSAAAASPVIVAAINELIKWQEIKADIRNQRRARLDFGTKLGMNSPF